MNHLKIPHSSVCCLAQFLPDDKELYEGIEDAGMRHFCPQMRSFS